MIDTVSIHCPFCGESFETTIDLSAGSQQYIEDCAVCCRPINIAMQVGNDGELIDIVARNEAD